MSQKVIHKKAMLEALKKTLGIVTPAAEVVGINPRTHYRWKNEDEEYKAEVDAIEDIALDYVEGKLFKLIDNEKEASCIFYMKTKGKKRGYVERVEQDVSINLPQVTIEIVN